MIIAVQGTHYGNNEAVKVMNALAVMGVAKDQLTTLMLQFVNKTRKSAEQYLIGATLKNESLIQDTSVPDISSGMDALCNHMLGVDDDAKFFSEVSRSLTTDQHTRNVFDITASTRKPSFEKEILNKQQKSHAQDKDFLEVLLKSADNTYKMVFVLMPSKNQALCQEILKYADVNIICVHQGEKEPVTHGGQREMFVATDYCSGSMYNSKTLAQMYDQKIIYGCMHDIQYNDACACGKALSYLSDNMSATPKSAAYNLIHNIEILYNAIMRKTGRKTEDIDPDSAVRTYNNIKLIRTEFIPITEPVVREVITTGIFKKRSVSNVVLQPDDHQMPIEDYIQESQEPSQEIMANAAMDGPVEDGMDMAPVEIADESTIDLSEEMAEPEIIEKPKKKKGLGGLFTKKEKKIKKAVPVEEIKDVEAKEEIEDIQEIIQAEEEKIESPGEQIELPDIFTEPIEIKNDSDTEVSETTVTPVEDQTLGDAMAEQILNTKVAWSNGSKDEPVKTPKKPRRKTKKVVEEPAVESSLPEDTLSGVSEVIKPETPKPKRKKAAPKKETKPVETDTSESDGWTFD